MRFAPDRGAQMISRRQLVVSAALLGAGCTVTDLPRRPSGFVSAEGIRLTLDGVPYRFTGANMYYGAYLGAQAPLGNRDRLKRELDSLKALGVTNLRVLGASELSPLKNSLKPAFHTNKPPLNETLLEGLDFLLAEMGARGMRAVIYVGNFWEWSGGFATYLYWTNGGRYIDMNDPAHPWPEFADFSAQFYASAPAVALYRDYVRSLVTRTNTITHRAYREDATIMAWQLANEPRPAGSDAFGASNMKAFRNWISGTAAFIKSLDENHLVSTGNEGLKGCLESADCVSDAHRVAEIDYLTCHIWPLNWAWVDAKDLPGTYEKGEQLSADYLDRHVALATALNKPLIVEEFGFPRDVGSYDPGTATTFRDRFYTTIYARAAASASDGGPVAGSNFWGWGGSGRPMHPDHRMQAGETAYVGDPPHEPQGWYSVFDNDVSTLQIIRANAAAMKG
jgi:mannan endo-1,4-beta-mannosidase